MKFIDIHSHILWGVDDGAENFNITKNILDLAVKNNIETIVATPHINRDNNKDISATIEKVEKRFGELQAYIKQNNLQMNTVLGYEVYFSHEILKLPDKILKKLTIGDSSYILIELPFDTFSPAILNGLYEIRKRGFDPIIAHPERDRAFIENPELMVELVNKDILVQINFSSIIGKNGKQAKKLTIKLLKAGLVHFIASDIHNEDSQYLDFKGCHKIVAQLTSEDFASLLLFHNPDRVLKNKIILEPSDIYPYYLKDTGLFLDYILSPLEKIISKFKKRV